MDIGNEQNKSFLMELCKIADGDSTAQVSMYDVGTALGMEKGEAGIVAEELIVDGLVELVNLSGGVSISAEGLKFINREPDMGAGVKDITKLGVDPVLSFDKCKAVEETLQRYRDAVEKKQIPYSRLEEIIIDIKTLEIQLISIKPKTSIVRAILFVLAGYASEDGLGELEQQLAVMTGK